MIRIFANLIFNVIFPGNIFKSVKTDILPTFIFAIVAELIFSITSF